MGSKLSKKVNLEKNTDDLFDFGNIIFNIVTLESSKDAIKLSDKIKDQSNKNFDAIESNLELISENYDAIRAISSKVNTNLDLMILMFEKTSENFKSMQTNIKNEFDKIRKSVSFDTSEKSKAAISILQITEQVISRKIMIHNYPDDVILIAFLQSIGLPWLQMSKENLLGNMTLIIKHFNSKNMIDSSIELPKKPDDEQSINLIQVLLVGLQAYFQINSGLINAYKFMAYYNYKISDYDKFNSFALNLIDEMKKFQISLIDLIDNVKKIMEKMKNFDLIVKQRTDIVYFLIKMLFDSQELITRFNEIKNQNNFIQMKPEIIKMEQLNFEKSNISIPFGNWIKGHQVSYALQYKNQTEYSLISDFSSPYELKEKACPILKLDEFKQDEEKIIFRKFSNGKIEHVGEMIKDQKEFRDINRDLLDAVIGEENEELAIKNLNLLLKNGANINTSFEKEKKLIHFAVVLNKSSNLIVELIKNNASVHLGDQDGLRPIHYATEKNSKEMVKILLDYGSDVNERTNLNWTPIHYALKIQSDEMFHLLVNGYRANIKLITENDFNVYHIASAIADKNNMIKILEKIKDIDIDAKSSRGLTSLHLSTIGQYSSNVEQFLKNDLVDVNAEIEGYKFTALHLAAINGNVDIVKKLLEHKNINVNQMTTDGFTPLHLAIISKREKVAQELILTVGKTIDVNSQSESGHTALHFATLNNMTLIAQLLIMKGARVEDRDLQGDTALHFACQNGNIDLALNSLIEQGKASINVRDQIGNTPLMRSVLYDQLKMVQFLSTKNGIRIDDKNNQLFGFRAIDLAAFENRKEIFNFLMNKSCPSHQEKYITRNYLQNAFFLACLGANMEIIKLLIEQDSTFLDISDANNNNALFYATQSNNLEVLKFLIQKTNFNLNQTNNVGNNLLHYSSLQKNFKMVRYLSEKKVNQNQINKDGFIPILVAAEAKAWPIVEYLLKDRDRLSVNVTQVTNDKNSILHYACNDNQIQLIKYFLDDLKFDVNQKNNDRYAPISFATRNGNFQLVRYLFEEKFANYLIVDKFGLDLLHLSASSGNLELVKYFVKQGLDVKSPDGKTSCLHLASSFDHLEVITYLLDKGVNIDAIDENKSTSLLLAARTKSWTAFKYLLEKNANTQLMDKDRNCIVHEIAKTNRLDILQLLKYKPIAFLKAPINNQGQSPLHIAVLSKQQAITRYLIDDWGLFGFVKDNLGNQIIHYSAQLNDLPTTIYLAERFKSNEMNNMSKTPCDLTESLSIAKYLIEVRNSTYNKDPLFNAENSNLGILKYIIKYIYESLNPNMFVDDDQSNMLIKAAKNSSLSMVKYLVGELKMEIEFCGSTNKDATYWADYKNHLDIALYLDEMNSRLKNSESAKWYQMVNAITNNDFKSVALLVRRGHIDVNLEIDYPNIFPSNEQKSLLHVASSNCKECVRYLLSKGANLTSITSSGILPLHLSAYYGRTDIARFFIVENKEKIMNVNLTNNFNETSLHFASQRKGNLKTIKFLIERDINLYARANNDLAFHLACKGAFDAVKFFIRQKEIDVNIRGFKNRTCLHNAAYHNQFRIVEFLSEENTIDFHLTDTKGLTAYDLALKKGYKIIASYLKSKMQKFSLNFMKSSLNNQETKSSLNNQEIKSSLNNQEIKSFSRLGSMKNFKPAIGNQKSNNTNLSIIQDNVDIQSNLMLFNVLVRKFSNQKFVTDYQELSLIETRMIALNIIDCFEKILEKNSKKLDIIIDDFEPTLLLSDLIWYLRNDELKKIPKLLVSSLKNLQPYLIDTEIQKKLERKLEIKIKKILTKEFK